MLRNAHRCFSSSATLLSIGRKRRRLPFIPTTITTPSAEEAVNNILYNAPGNVTSPSTRHVLNCLVANEPGVLSRVSGILAGRGFNIDSLVVAKTEVPDLSRMTIVLNGQDGMVEQARRQLEDIVPVWAVLDYTNAGVVEREVLLVKVSTVPSEFHREHEDGRDEIIEQPTIIGGVSPLLSSSIQRSSIIELARQFNARVVDVSVDSCIVELTAKPKRVDAFLNLLKPYGIIEATRSGAMAMPRTPVDLFDQDHSGLQGQEEEMNDTVDATLLPPG